MKTLLALALVSLAWCPSSAAAADDAGVAPVQFCLVDATTPPADADGDAAPTVVERVEFEVLTPTPGFFPSPWEDARRFKLKRAEAGPTRDLLEALFRREFADDSFSIPGIDSQARTLDVRGRKAHLDQLVDVLTEMDRERPTHRVMSSKIVNGYVWTCALYRSRAARVAAELQKLLRERLQSGALTLAADERINVVYVKGAWQSLQPIDTLVAFLDSSLAEEQADVAADSQPKASVESADAPADPDRPVPARNRAEPDRATVRLNHVRAPWEKVFKELAQATGREFISKSQLPRGSFTRLDPTTRTLTSALAIVNPELQPLGYRLEDTGKLLVLTEIREAIANAADSEVRPTRATRVIAPKATNVPTLASALSELFGVGDDRLTITFDVDKKSITLTATRELLDRAVAASQTLDVPSNSRESIVLRLKNQSAVLLAPLVARLFGDANLIVVAEPGTNSLLISASDELRSRIRKLVNAVDNIPDSAGEIPAADAGGPPQEQVASIRVLKLQSQDATAAVNFLQGLFSDRMARDNVRFSTDLRTNAVVVVAPEDAMAAAEQVVRALDTPAAAEMSQTRRQDESSEGGATPTAAGVNQQRAVFERRLAELRIERFEAEVALAQQEQTVKAIEAAPESAVPDWELETELAAHPRVSKLQADILVHRKSLDAIGKDRPLHQQAKIAAEKAAADLEAVRTELAPQARLDIMARKRRSATDEMKRLQQNLDRIVALEGKVIKAIDALGRDSARTDKTGTFAENKAPTELGPPSVISLRYTRGKEVADTLKTLFPELAERATISGSGSEVWIRANPEALRVLQEAVTAIEARAAERAVDNRRRQDREQQEMLAQQAEYSRRQRDEEQAQIEAHQPIARGFELKYIRAAELKKLLNELYPQTAHPLAMSPDERGGANTLWVNGSKKLIGELEAIIERHDRPAKEGTVTEIAPQGPAGTPNTEFFTFRLQHQHAPDVAQTLQTLFSGDDSEGDVRITAMPTTNSIAVRARREAFAKIGAMLKTLDVPAADQVATDIKIFKLERARADDLRQTVAAIYANSLMPLLLSVDERTNALIAKGPAEVLREVEAIALRLDTGETVAPRKTPAAPAAPANPADYRQRERDAAAKGETLRKLTAELNAANPRPADADKRVAAARAELRAAVAAAYEARKQLRLAETAALRQRVQQIEQQMTARDALREQIIDTRVEELLNPDRQWESEKDQPGPALPAVSRDAAPATLPASSREVPPGADGSFNLERLWAPRKALIDAEVAFSKTSARLQEAAIKADAMRTRLQEVKELHGKGTVSDRALRDAETESSLADAALQTVRFDVAAAKKQLDAARNDVAAAANLLKFDYDDARLKYEFARKEFEYYQRLHEKNVISRLEFDKHRLVLEQAKLQQDRAETIYRQFSDAYRQSEPKASNSESDEKKTQGAASPPPPQPAVVARVGDQPITADELAAEAIGHFGSQVLENLINRRIVEQACAAQKIEVTDAEIEEEINTIAKKFRLDVPGWLKMLETERRVTPAQYRHDIIWPMLALRKLAKADITITEEELSRAFVRDYGPRVKALAIVMGDQRVATTVWSKVQQDPDNFGQLAREYSTDQTSRPLGGRIPPIRRYGGREELENAAFRLKAGEISGVVQTGPDQFTILKCEGRTEPTVTDRADVEDVLRRELYDEKLQEAVAKVFAKLKQEARVENSQRPAATPQVHPAMPPEATLPPPATGPVSARTLSGGLSLALGPFDETRRALIDAEEAVAAARAPIKLAEEDLVRAGEKYRYTANLARRGRATAEEVETDRVARSGAETALENAKKNAAAAERNLNLAHYRMHVEITALEAQVRDAEQARGRASAEMQQSQETFEKDSRTKNDLDAKKLAFVQADLKMKRDQAILDLLRQALPEATTVRASAAKP